MLRLRHPDVFWGSIPSSGVIRSFSPLENNTDKFAANDFVSRNYYSRSFEAATKIHDAMASFNTCSMNGTCSSSGLLGALNLCDPQPNATELRTLYSSLTVVYKHISQFNYPFPAGYFDANPLATLLNATKSANSTANVLRAPMLVANWVSTDSDACIDWRATNVSGQTVSTPLGGSLSYNYIECTYFPVNQASIRPGNLLPATLDRGRFEECSLGWEWEGPLYNMSNEWWIGHYGLGEEALAQVDRMLYVDGTDDPIAALGTPRLPLNESLSAPRSVTVNGGSHTMDLMGYVLAPKGLAPALDWVSCFNYLDTEV